VNYSILLPVFFFKKVAPLFSEIRNCDYIIYMTVRAALSLYYVLK